MTMRSPSDAPARWRPARRPDLPAIDALAALVHPGYPEHPAVFANRLALHPSGMMLAEHDGAAVGYAIGHPWRGPAPMLDCPLGVLPGDPDGYWVHDVALLSHARGLGLGRAVLVLLQADAARSDLRTLRLVAVAGADRFWMRAGFVPEAGTPPSCYGNGARLMRRPG